MHGIKLPLSRGFSAVQGLISVHGTGGFRIGKSLSVLILQFRPESATSMPIHKLERAPGLKPFVHSLVDNKWMRCASRATVFLRKTPIKNF